MKRIYWAAWAASLIGGLLTFSGCAHSVGEVTSLAALKTDPTLPVPQGIKAVVDKTSVGFEWKPIEDDRVKGIMVYRGVPSGGGEERFEKIATIPNRYATHYVDTTVRPRTTYDYVFKSYSILAASKPSNVVRVKTPSALEPVGFIKVYQPESGVVKILWTPHKDPRVKDYIIQRKLGDGEWKYLDTVEGRLSPEYIDLSAARGYRYSYRVIARSSDGAQALPSRPVSLVVK